MLRFNTKEEQREVESVRRTKQLSKYKANLIEKREEGYSQINIDITSMINVIGLVIELEQRLQEVEKGNQ